MESQRQTWTLALFILGTVCAAPLLAEEPVLRPVETPPLLLETGEPAQPKENDPTSESLPVWIEDQAKTVGNAFDFIRDEETKPLPPAESSTSDIGELLTPTTDSSNENSSRAPAPTTAFPTQLAQLERAASEASTLHSLGRLAAAAETLATRPALSETDRLQAAKLASWAYTKRGRLFAATGRGNEALNDFDRAVRLSPVSTTALLDRAISLAKQGESERALQDFDRVLILAPEWAVALRNRATLLLGIGEDELALQDCNKALRKLNEQEHNADRARLLTLRGRVLHRLGHYNEAIADFDGALRVLPGDSLLHRLRGNVFAEVGFYEQAINDYLSAVHADPAMAEAYRSLAWVLATCPEKRLRNPSIAIEAAWRAQNLGKPGDPMMLDASAAAHASAGNFNEAIRLQQRALVAANPQSEPRFRQRLELYRTGHSYTSPVIASKRAAGNHRMVVPATHESTRKPNPVRPAAVAR